MANQRPHVHHGMRATYIENDAPIVISSEFELFDRDTATMVGATVVISHGYVMGEDVLGFANQNGISGSFDAVTGTLTLSGAASVADYQAALRSVTYENTSEDPTGSSRKFSFTVDDGQSEDNLSRSAKIRMKLVSVNDAPVLAVDPILVAINWQVPAAIDPTLQLTDVDSDMKAAVVQITGNYMQGQDALSYTPMFGIEGRFDASTGALSLRGRATAAEYEAVLRSVTYVNTSASPSLATRAISIRVEDSDRSDVGHYSSVGVISVVYAAPPVVTTSGTPLAYTEGDPALTLAAALAVADVDDPELVGATVSITSGFDAGDALLFTDTANIVGSYDTNTGVLTLTGTATVAEYQAALRTIQFVGTTDDPSASKTITWIVSGDTDDSAATTTTIHVTAVNDAPGLTITDTLDCTENDPAAVIAGTATVSDADSPDFYAGSLTVSFTLNGTSADQLAVRDEGTGAGQIGVSGANITYGGTTIGTFTGGGDGANLVVTFTTAAATPAAVQALVRNVTFANTSDNPSTLARTVSFTVVDGDGGTDSNSASAMVNITAVNDAPVVTASVGTSAYAEGGGAITIDGSIVVTDADNATLSSATVQITGNYLSGSDVLAFTGNVSSGNITGAFSAATGALTLSSAGNTATTVQWQSALRLVTFDTSSNSPGASRTISFQADDGSGANNLSSTVTKTISINETNSSPSVTTSGGSAAFVEDAGAIAIDTGITVADTDTTTLAGATVQIGTGFNTAQDVLAFTAGSGITGSYDSTTGTLTLGGVATVAQYEAVLATVTYNNTSNTPDTATRTVGFQVNDGQGLSNLSTVATRTVTVAATNDAPLIAAGSTIGYSENDAAAVIAPSATVSDADSADFNAGSLTVSFTANGASADQLAVRNEGAGAGQIGMSGANVTYAGTTIGTFTGGVNGADLVITFGTAAATPAAVQALVRNITFANTSESPSTSARTVHFALVDGDSGSDTGTADATVNVTSVNDSPALGGAAAGTVAYTENDAATVLENGLTLSDLDNTTVSGATVTVSNNYVAGEDVLAVGSVGAITGSFDAGTGVLTLSGTDTLANYQAALRGVTYANTSENPSAVTRTVSFQVNDGSAADNLSNTVTRDVSVTPVNDAPAIVAGGSLAYTENASGSVVNSTLALTDAEGDSVTGATATISANYASGQDVLSFTPSGAITGAFDAGTGVLTLSGTGTAADYQAALRTVTYHNTSDDPSTAARTVSFQATDSHGDSGAATTTVNVTAVNDAPSNTVPADASLGTAFSNTSMAISGVSIADVDAQGGTMTVALSAVSGGLTVSLAGGASVSAGTNGTGAVTLSGTATQLNAALATLSYKSNDGFTGSDTISVTTNDGANTGTGGAKSDTDSFHVGVIPQVFIIDNSNATADDANSGSSTNPFNSIASFNTLAADGTGDYIYLRNGTGTYSEADGFNLLDNQQLYGQGQSLQFTNPVTGEVVTIGFGASGTTPTVSITGAGNHAIDLAQGNTVTGLNLATTASTQTGIADGGGTVGTLTITNVNVTGTGMAVDIDQGGALNVAFGTLSSSGSSQQAVQLAASGAALTGSFTAGTGTISGSAGAGFLVGDGTGTANTGGAAAISYGGAISTTGAARAVDIQDRAAGAGTITLTGNISHTSGNATTIFVDDIAAGAISFSGANTLNSGTANALQVTDVTGGGVTFSGTLDIDTTSGAGIWLGTNAAAANFTGSQITVNTSSGIGINIASNSGAVSFANAGNGLDVVTTAGGTGISASNSGTLTVTGAGNTISSTNAGALSVSNTAIGASGLNFLSIASSGGTNGILLSSTGSTGSLKVTGSGTANSGGAIVGTTGDGISVSSGMINLAYMLIQNSAGNGVNASNLLGTNTLANSTITGFDWGGTNSENGLRIVNAGSSTLGSMTVSNSTFSGGSSGNDAIFMEDQGTGNMTLTISGSTFTGLYGDAVQVNGITGATGTVRLTIQNSTFQNAVAGTGNGGISLNPFGDVNFIADINNNAFSAIMNPVTTLGAIGMTNGGTADADVTIRNNTINNIAGGRGITITADGGTTDLLIDNNNIDNLGSTFASAISVNFTDYALLGTVGTGNVTVSNNDIGQNGTVAGNLWTSGSGTAYAILLQALNGASMTGAVTNNVVDANASLEVVRIRAASTGAVPGTINATVTGNTLQDTDTASRMEFDATAGNSTSNPGTLNLSISSNVLNSGNLSLTERTAGTLNVTQADVSSANGGVAVTVTGSPSYGAPSPTSPTTPSLPLLVQGAGSGDATPLTQDSFLSLVSAAVQRWAASGLSAAQLDTLSHLQFGVVSMDADHIGAAGGNIVLVDDDAGGRGWFVDATPLDDREFAAVTPTQLWGATHASAAGVDLLTALMHEIGHTLGYSDGYAAADADSLMFGYLSVGERRLPDVAVTIVGASEGAWSSADAIGTGP